MKAVNSTTKNMAFALKLLDRFLKSEINVDGLEYLEMAKEHPVVFVVNHFTRAETFILPYIIEKNIGVIPRSLADSELFSGKLGDLLTNLGTLSVKDPHRDITIIGDLMKGERDWVIFPEGMMVKNKRIFVNGRYEIHGPDRVGPPRTGAAILALKAALYKKNYEDAINKNNKERMQIIENEFGIQSLEDLCDKEIAIIPVNITYYPIRPGTNIIHKATKRFFDGMSTRLEEELQIEGNLLLKETDIQISFNRPFFPRDYLFEDYKVFNYGLNLLGVERRNQFTLWYQKHRLTQGFMKVIYESLTINFDHIFCCSLRRLKEDVIPLDAFYRRLFVIAYEIRQLKHKLHNSLLSQSFIKILTGENYEPLTSILNLAHDGETVEIKEGMLHLKRENMLNIHHFHNIRLNNTMRILANELEPVQDVVSIINKRINSSPNKINKRITEIVQDLDQDIFKKDYKEYFISGESKKEEIVKPFYLSKPKNEWGIVLSHGYMSAPEEVRPLANYLFEAGFNVYVTRLRGHGTAPENLASVVWDDWYNSYLRAYAVVKHDCKNIVFGGFSTGGLLALLNASRHQGVKGAFCINAPLKLMDIKSKLIPAVNLWNDILDVFNIESGKKEFIENKSENPHINYSRNCVHGVQELGILMKHVEKSLPSINCPTMIIQGSKDPTVNPESAKLIFKSIKSKEKYLEYMDFDRHVIVQKEGSEAVFQKVLSFVQKIQNL